MNKENSKSFNYEQSLYEVVKDDQRFVVLTAENLAAIRNLPPLLDGRFIDTGINFFIVFIILLFPRYILTFIL